MLICNLLCFRGKARQNEGGIGLIGAILIGGGCCLVGVGVGLGVAYVVSKL